MRKSGKAFKIAAKGNSIPDFHFSWFKKKTCLI